MYIYIILHVFAVIQKVVLSLYEYLITKGKDKIRGDPVDVVLQLTIYHPNCAKLFCPQPNATVKDKYSPFTQFPTLIHITSFCNGLRAYTQSFTSN